MATHNSLAKPSRSQFHALSPIQRIYRNDPQIHARVCLEFLALCVLLLGAETVDRIGEESALIFTVEFRRSR